MDINQVYNELKTIIPLAEIQCHETLKNHVYTKMGGQADIRVLPSSYDEVQSVIKYAKDHHLTITILGNGSNVIIRDGGIRGIVVQLTNLQEIMIDEHTLRAHSGASIIQASQIALQNQLTGLEFACGIPGTVGGALYMNAGAYGGEIADVLQDALVVDSSGNLLTLHQDDMDWGYRHSIFAGGLYTILEARFALRPGVYSSIKDKMDELTFLRESKQPLEYPSCGSVFKRPPNRFAGQLIQESGLQGVRIGGAEVSTKHAGFIVNVDNATASDYISLVSHVRDTVKGKFGIELETEVKFIGEE
ncbi:UDP-N-acetylmuramate dehydrogenase [Paenibacillus crassostreae]|uniref:UDP-N-acetylenolpyruvoylglucosamine reductase n=1 Tax=Paenibacillus crassostreae TaxID=1763538 RepID=A0A167FGG5_9BACL|nr:UDP-N-acetylmuramate dehydrogenase [Paenibacillus crassostreae]AOZ94427.1 UDP-N-acetylenolpyruvoylglucosamine reductase [Paenibacillus crassostreae]OAB76536.1 UDP-N-acetylenolpyruvoylglucosamine reductase [Paenibacillus crassostreae]